MKQIKMGVIAVASQYESGGQRAEEQIASITAALCAKGITAIAASKVAWDAADAIDVAKEFRAAGVESLTIVLSTWVTDSLLYVMVNEMHMPTVLWAVPYTETFSIGCVQHFGCALTTHGIPFEYVYGLADSADAVERTVNVARAAWIIRCAREMKLALVGPRQTWRVAGPQDSTNEEWEFSGKFGATLVHIETEEIIAIADGIGDDEARCALKRLSGRTGKVLADEATMLRLSKVYLAVKQTVKRYSLDALATECYPFYSGLMNLPSSWLADEGIVVDTEGDISHTMVMHMLNLAAESGATALGEVGSMTGDILALTHEGSTAHSLAESPDKVQISPSGDHGAFVGLALRPMEKVTVASLQGNGRDGYQMLVEKGSVVAATREEWVNGGEKLLIKLKLDQPAQTVVERMIAKGMDHHLLVKEGDYTDILRLICKFMKVNVVSLH